MKFGFFPTEGGSFDGMITEAQVAEAVGFDSCWVCEHHASEENYWPAPLLRLAGIATVTEELELIPAVVLPALHNAVSLAEECATLDQLSDGRLTIGAGLGYVPEEFEAYGIPMSERAGRFVESLRFLDRYLSSEEPVSFDGKFWTVGEFQPTPTTVQKPRPGIWVGGWGELALQRSVRLADGWLPGGTADLDALIERQETLKQLVEQSNQQWSDRPHPLMREVIVADTDERVKELVEGHLAHTYADEYGSEEWSHPLIKDEDADDIWSLARERFIVGTPAEIVEEIERFRSRMTVDHIGCRFHHPGMSHEDVRRQIELFGDEVIPELS